MMKNARKQKTRSSATKQKTRGSSQKQKTRGSAPAGESDAHAESITLKPVALHSEGAGMSTAKPMELTKERPVKKIKGLTIGGKSPGASGDQDLSAQIKAAQEIMAEADKPSLQGEQGSTHELPSVRSGEVEHKATQTTGSSKPVVTFGGPRPPIKSSRDVPKE